MSWTAPAINGASITEHTVQYRPTAIGSCSAFARTASATTTQTVATLTATTNHDIQIAAVNLSGAGSFSATAATKTATAFDDLNRSHTTASAGLGTTAYGSQTWTSSTLPAWQIDTNQGLGVGTVTSEQVTTFDSGLADFTISMTVAALGNAGLSFRSSGNQNFSLVRTGDTTSIA